MDNLDEIQALIGTQTMEAIPFDVSTRRYFRTEKGVLMIDQDEGASLRLANFTDIAKRLRRADLRAPEIYEADADKGFLLIEDFGSTALKSANSDDNLQRAFALLDQVKTADYEGLKLYSEEVYAEEMSRLQRFYLRPLGIEDDEILGIAAPMFEALAAKAEVFVHLDYHPENLMVLENGDIGLLDFQDARQGHPLYDFASYFDGIRMAMPEHLRASAEARLSTEEYHDYRHLAAQRLIKVIGIFARMIGEGREKYQVLMPAVFDSLHNQFQYDELGIWREWFNDVVPRPSAQIYEELRHQNEDN